MASERCVLALLLLVGAGRFSWNVHADAPDSITAKYESMLARRPRDISLRYFYGKALVEQGHVALGVKQYSKGLKILKSSKTPSEAPLLPDSDVWAWAVLLHKWGEALVMLGHREKAHKGYSFGVDMGLWQSPFQRYLTRPVPLLPAASSPPVWRPGTPGYPVELVQVLESNAHLIRGELERLVGRSEARRGVLGEDGGHGEGGRSFSDEPEGLSAGGKWDVYGFIKDGEWDEDHCREAPITCGILRGIPSMAEEDEDKMVVGEDALGGAHDSVDEDAIEDSDGDAYPRHLYHSWPECVSTHCDAFFSRIQSGTHIKPHCGPTTHRMRVHLGLVIPVIPSSSSGEDQADGGVGSTRPAWNIRVAEEVMQWEEGKALVFDDSYEHEVWEPMLRDMNDPFDSTPLITTTGDSATPYASRIILSIDVWHPAMSPHVHRRNPPHATTYKAEL